MDKGKIKSS